MVRLNVFCVLRNFRFMIFVNFKYVIYVWLLFSYVREFGICFIYVIFLVNLKIIYSIKN